MDEVKVRLTAALRTAEPVGADTVLVFETDGSVSADTALQLRDYVRAQVPGTRVLFLSGGLRLAHVLSGVEASRAMAAAEAQVSGSGTLSGEIEDEMGEFSGGVETGSGR